MRIPVFHDDQHGTAITVAAAVRNGLVLQGKTLAGREAGHLRAPAPRRSPASICWSSMGLRPENVTLTDIEGVVRTDRAGHAAQHGALRTRYRTRATLRDVLAGADIFLGLSAPRVLKPEWLAAAGAEKPLILALANPDPEILPELVAAARPDAIIATGRSDYPNQVNNVLCFPFIFRGALDVSATTINEAMKIAAVEAIAGAGAHGGERGGRRGLWRCRAGVRPGLHHPQAVRSAADPGDRAGGGACRDGQRRRAPADRAISPPISANWNASSSAPASSCVRSSRRRSRRRRRIVYAEGEDERVLRAAQTLVDDGHRDARSCSAGAT